MTKHKIAAEDELSVGDRIIVQLKGREIAVFNLDGEYHAMLNWCPHQSGPLCEGPVSGTVDAEFDAESLTTTTSWVKEGQIVACPWHGWEFEISTGECLSKENTIIPKYPVSTEEGDIYVEIG